MAISATGLHGACPFALWDGVAKSREITFLDVFQPSKSQRRLFVEVLKEPRRVLNFS